MTFRKLKLRENLLKKQNNNFLPRLSRLCRESLLYMTSRILLSISAIISLLIFNHSVFHKTERAELSLSSEVTFSAVGDLMCHSPQFEYARTSDGGFNFEMNYYYVREIISRSNIAFANFETVLAGRERKFSGYPTFNTPDEFLQAVKNAGFDFLFTSNNHSFDRGREGVKKTILKIKKSGLGFAGTSLSEKESDSLRIIKINDVTAGILSYADHLNGFKLPKGENYLVNLIDSARIRRDILRLRKEKPDLVILYFHFGDEYQKEPSRYLKQIVRTAITAGADIILASHPHVLQRIETFKPVNSSLDTGFVAYSLGNFISNQRWRYSDAGTILNFSIIKESGNSIKLKKIEITPTWVYKGKFILENIFAVLPSELAFQDKYPPFLSKNDLMKMRESYLDAEKILLKGFRLSPSKIILKKFPHLN